MGFTTKVATDNQKPNDYEDPSNAPLHVASMSRGVAGSDWEALELKGNRLQPRATRRRAAAKAKSLGQRRSGSEQTEVAGAACSPVKYVNPAPEAIVRGCHRMSACHPVCAALSLDRSRLEAIPANKGPFVRDNRRPFGPPSSPGRAYNQVGRGC